MKIKIKLRSHNVAETPQVHTYCCNPKCLHTAVGKHKTCPGCGSLEVTVIEKEIVHEVPHLQR